MNIIRSLFSLWCFRLLFFVASGIALLDVFWFTQVPSAQFLSKEEGELLTAEARVISFFGGMAGFLLYWRIKGSFSMIDNYSSHTEN